MLAAPAFSASRRESVPGTRAVVFADGGVSIVFIPSCSGRDSAAYTSGGARTSLERRSRAATRRISAGSPPVAWPAGSATPAAPIRSA